jgi:hypothetical protein
MFVKQNYFANKQDYFNQYLLKSMNAIEMPLSIRYQLGKVSLMAGANIGYQFAIKNTTLQNQKSGDAVSVNSPTDNFVNTTGTINPTLDFRSRFTLGYTAGLVYDFSKYLRLDLRVNQNLFTSAKSTSTLYSSIYKTPSIQLSLCYFIGKKDKVIYMIKDRK